MTLEPYDPDRLDQMSLRLLDLCSRVRAMARKCREDELAPVELHDRKALEWLEKFEDWLFRAEGELGRSALKTRGERRARQSQSVRPK